MSTETIPAKSEYDQVRLQIEAIDADPEHKLPEGIAAVIKLGYWYPVSKTISGMIWYSPNKLFPNGYPVNTAEIVSREPGGIYCTALNKYLVEIIDPEHAPHG